MSARGSSGYPVKWKLPRSRVRTHLESPWNCSRCWEVLEFQCYLYYSSSRTPKEKKQTQKDLRDKITHVVEELKKLKKTDSRIFFALNGVLDKWKICTLKCLNFMFKKRVPTLPFFTFFISRSSDKRRSITKPQTEHCDGVCANGILQTRNKSSVGSVQEEDRCSSRKDAFPSDKLFLWQMKNFKTVLETIDS